MDSIGSFKLKEVDGKRSYVYIPPIYSNEPAIDSGESEGHLSQTRFFCRRGRAEAQRLEIGDSSDSDTIVKIDSSPHFRSVALQIKSDDDYERLDRLNRHVVLPLFWCNNKPEHWSEGWCGACIQATEVGEDFYFCGECDRKYHKECIESPPQINHPFHPKHPLQLWDEIRCENCFRCKQVSVHVAYHCTICEFSMHPLCAVEPIPYVIEQCKRHNHPLTFFTKKAPLDCNVCGLTNVVDPTYVCLECSFAAHSDCADSPHVIRICRHQHRISFVLPLPSGIQSCGVCRKEVSREYGGYTCTKNCDDYVVHSRCALRRDIWDGEELAGVPEEEEEVVDPFERIREGIIRHFTHEHLLRLETSRVYEESKICDACVIPIYEGDFYSCEECDFILHDTCANAPRRKISPLHAHPLTLTVLDGNRGFYNYLNCDACCVCTGSGFIYECEKKGCRFTLDVRCASISEPFKYEGHDHPLFLALDPKEGLQRCQVCQSFYTDLLNCIKCDYIICFKCVTIPYMVRYKHDKHFLTLGYGDETSKPDWCQVCEKRLPPGSRDKRFYTCNHCCTTLHIECLLGKDRYMKPGHTVTNGRNTRPAGEILLNNSLSRPTCDECKSRCEDKIIVRRHNKTWCSYVHFYHFST